nr:TonB-dependent receptor [Pseudomonadota bacterium]
AQDRITLHEKWIVLGGLRYDGSSARNVFVSGETGEREVSERDDEEITTQFGVVYRPLEPLSLYANRTEAFVPQIGNVFGGAPFAPELSTQYEVGAKFDVAGGRLAANIAVFEITKENVVTADPDRPGFQLAVGETRSRGIETSIAGEPLPGWSLMASYTFTETEITRDFEGFEGNEFIGVADHTASLFTRYDLQGGDLKGLGLSAGVTYVGERQGDLDNSFELPDYTRVDLGLHYAPSDAVEVSLLVENAFDEEYALSGFGIQRLFPGAPRTFNGRIVLRF